MLAGTALAGLFGLPRQGVAGAGRHAIAMHGDPALAEGFSHFRYVDPAAPQGGRLVIGLLGTFDSLNPFIVRGLAVQQVRSYVIESLLTRGYDEPFTLYGLLAQTVETDAARSYVIFALDPRARFSDGTPVTPEDVLFSWELLRDKGRPNHRTYYTKVARATAVDARTVRFDFSDPADRELPLILGLMPIFSRQATKAETFEETTFVSPVGSGPYVVSEVRPGERVSFKRNPAFWGRDLSVTRGYWNFEEIRLDYYRDINSHFEAFKRGLYDVRAETDPGRWEQAYDGTALRSGHIIKDTFQTGLPKGMSALVFNTRRPIFSDVRVREALGHLFDFEWVNHNFFFDRYSRANSYYTGSELSSHGRPADAVERRLLAPYPGAVRADILEGKWSPPVSDGSGRDRTRLRAALELLAAAGWGLVEGQLLERKSGQPFGFELMVTSKDHERLGLAIVRDFKRAGIAMSVRLVDTVQYEQRRNTFDFDMMPSDWSASLSPGNEQYVYWSRAAADEQGSRNYMGVKEQAVDAMIAAMLAATERSDFVSAVRALDRVLLSGFYVVPLFYLPDQWVARWSHIGRPQVTSLYGYLPETWWRQPATP